jgi:hypothetical protein
MRGSHLTRIRTAWGSKRALAQVLGCSRHMIRSNEGRSYVTVRMRLLMKTNRGRIARALARGYWLADRQIKGGKHATN